MFVKPADGLMVRDPVTKRHIDPEGVEVPDTPYWIRRLASGDVVPATPPAAAAPAPRPAGDKPARRAKE